MSLPLDAFDRLGRMADHLRPVARHASRDFAHASHDVAHDIAALRRDVALLAEIARRNGSASLAIGGETAHELAHLTQRGGALALRELERQVEGTGRAIQRRPLPALAILGGLLVVGFVLLRRGD